MATPVADDNTHLHCIPCRDALNAGLRQKRKAEAAGEADGARPSAKPRKAMFNDVLGDLSDASSSDDDEQGA